QQYEQFKAERDNQTTELAINIALKSRTIPMFDDNANPEDFKRYVITKMYELSSKNHYRLNEPIARAEATIDRFKGTFWDQYTIKPINRTEVVEVFRRVHQYYEQQDRLEKERMERPPPKIEEVKQRRRRDI
ncbi:Hypothetical predicted protein, partial [Olea europaea subsp. europaea]